MNSSSNSRVQSLFKTFSFALALIALLAIVWWTYHPGLSGDFLFDDFANLPAIGATGPVDNWATFWRYITSGNADPTGRPLTLLTFLTDARNWPANPYPFKVTNLVLHLVNGALLAWVLWRLGAVLATTSPIPSFRTPRSGDPESASSSGSPGPAAGHWFVGVTKTDSGFDPRIKSGAGSAVRPGMTSTAVAPGRRCATPRMMTDEKGIAIAALFGAGAWLLHPLFVSTTLYIVQREAMLPAMFVLIGMLGWTASREALARGHTRRALAGMALSSWLCTGLAILSKANGALLPLLLLSTEWIVLSRQPMQALTARAWHRRAVSLFLVLPSVLVAAYLLYLLPHSLSTPVEARGWSIGQRLLTQPRVLVDYLRLLFVPHAHSSGLFNDAFPISTDWLHPGSTVPCVILVLGLIGVGFASRKRYPAVALALLFYFAAQLMESGWIPLELYFEHRNYLPAMLLFWPIGLALGRPGVLRFLKIAAGAAILGLLAVLTTQRAALWGDGFRQAQVWAAINPDSARAQANAALYDMAHERPRLAAARLRLSLPRHPDDIQAPINLIGAECKLGAVQPQTLVRAEFALARTRLGGEAAFKWFNEALDLASRRACSGLDFSALQATLDAARSNPHWQGLPGRQEDLDHLQGQLDLAEGKAGAALQSFNQALAVNPKPGAALQQAAYLGSHGYPKLGLEHLDYFAGLPPAPKPAFGMPRIHAWVLHKQDWWETETAYLRSTLRQDAREKAAKVEPNA